MNSIRKGKRFEREVAKLLTELTNAEWKRVPMSGAFSTKNVKNPIFKGDVFTEDKEFSEYVIECKITKKKFLLFHLINKKGRLWDWWEQAEREAEGLIPILIFKDGSHRIYALAKDNKKSREFLAKLNAKTIKLDDMLLAMLKDLKRCSKL